MAVTWYAIVDSAGNLVSTGTNIADPATLAANGYTAITLPANPYGQVWDPTTKTFGPPPVPHNSYPTWQWIQRFTPAEFAAVASSTDPQVKEFMLMVQTSPTIKPQDPIVQQALQYTVSLNLITSARAAVLGAN